MEAVLGHADVQRDAMERDASRLIPSRPRAADKRGVWKIVERRELVAAGQERKCLAVAVAVLGVVESRPIRTSGLDNHPLHAVVGVAVVYNERPGASPHSPMFANPAVRPVAESVWGGFIDRADERFHLLEHVHETLRQVGTRSLIIVDCKRVAHAVNHLALLQPRPPSVAIRVSRGH